MVQIFYTLSMKESCQKRLRVKNDFNFDRYAAYRMQKGWNIRIWLNGAFDQSEEALQNIRLMYIFRIPPSSWELNAPIAPDEPDMDEYQSRTLQDVLGSIYSGFGFSSEVETPAISAAPSRRSSNRSSIRSAHSIKLKRKNRNEFIFGIFLAVRYRPDASVWKLSWLVDPCLTKSFQAWFTSTFRYKS